MRTGVEPRVLQPSTVPNRYTVPWQSSLFSACLCIDPRQRLLRTVVYVCVFSGWCKGTSGGLNDLTV